MKITRRQLRKLIIEFDMSGIGQSTIDINDIIRGGSGFPPPPDEPIDRGEGGNSCEDPQDPGQKFDTAYNNTLDAFEVYLVETGQDYMTYFDHLGDLGIEYEVSVDFLSDGLLYEIAMALCKGKIKAAGLHVIFDNPARYV